MRKFGFRKPRASQGKRSSAGAWAPLLTAPQPVRFSPPQSSFTTGSITHEAARFFDASSLSRGSLPTFKLLVGSVCSGKTTLRRAEYGTGFVVIDAAEVFSNLCRGARHEFPSLLAEPMNLVGGTVAQRALAERRHIVTEVLGDSPDELRQLIGAVAVLGYHIDVKLVRCDPAECVRRHQARAADEVSCCVAQRYHLAWQFDGAVMAAERATTLAS